MHLIELILASASPRRSELLTQLGVSYRCDPAAIDETVHKGEAAVEYVQRMAREKAQVVSERYQAETSVVLAADTSVVIDDVILGKPEDYADALNMLTLLSGSRHTVMTAVCLQASGSVQCKLVATDVDFAYLSQAQCEAYLATSEPWDKAGAYAIQGIAAAFVTGIHGSYSNVVGLPLFETWQMLKSVGVPGALTVSNTAQ